MAISEAQNLINGVKNHLSISPHNDFKHDTPVPLEVPVLIIGGGPTGLLQAYLLAQLQSTLSPPCRAKLTNDCSQMLGH